MNYCTDYRKECKFRQNHKCLKAKCEAQRSGEDLVRFKI